MVEVEVEVEVEVNANATAAGDGFPGDCGCLKSCSNNGSTTNTMDCCKGKLCKKKVIVLVGVLISAFFFVAAIALYFLLRRPGNKNGWDVDPACLPRILGRGICTRLFTYEELNKATRKIEEDHNSVDNGSVHTGMLDDGTLIAIQKIQCQTEDNFRQTIDRVDTISRISNRNIAGIIGCCVSSSFSLLLVHEFFAVDMLDEVLLGSKGGNFSWYHRINIATEIAWALVYLQCEISPPIYLHDIKSRDIYIDDDYSAKISSLKFLTSGLENGSCSYEVYNDSHVVYNFGVILLELIVGSRPELHSEIIVRKINERKFDEIVDPCLEFSEQLPAQIEQIERVACFAIQCLSSRENGRMCMALVVKELMRIAKDSLRSKSGIEPALEVTFSNSSLLQMISMSPDSSFSRIPEK